MTTAAAQSTAVAIPDKWKKDLERYDDKAYLVLAPLDLGPIPAMHTPMASVVKIDPDPAQGDVYHLQGKFAYSKSALDRIAAAAGVSWLPEMCGRTDAGNDPEIVRFRMAGKRKELDGQWRVVVREYEFDLKAREEELRASAENKNAEVKDPAQKKRAVDAYVSKEMIQLRKFKLQRAESGAANRVIRVFLGIKANYTREQIARPVVVPKLTFTPDYNDPEVKRFMLAEATGTIQELYNSQAIASRGTYSAPIVVQESPEELEEGETQKAITSGGNGEGGKVIDLEPEPKDDTHPSTSQPSDAPPPDASVLFLEAFSQEQAAGSPEVKAEALADQVKALESLITEAKYDPHKMKAPLGKFTREERSGFHKHLLTMIEERRKAEAKAQEAMPWGQ